MYCEGRHRAVVIRAVLVSCDMVSLPCGRTSPSCRDHALTVPVDPTTLEDDHAPDVIGFDQ